MTDEETRTLVAGDKVFCCAPDAESQNYDWAGPHRPRPVLVVRTSFQPGLAPWVQAQAFDEATGGPIDRPTQTYYPKPREIFRDYGAAMRGYELLAASHARALLVEARTFVSDLDLADRLTGVIAALDTIEEKPDGE